MGTPDTNHNTTTMNINTHNTWANKAQSNNQQVTTNHHQTIPIHTNTNNTNITIIPILIPVHTINKQNKHQHQTRQARTQSTQTTTTPIQSIPPPSIPTQKASPYNQPTNRHKLQAHMYTHKTRFILQLP